MAQKDDDAAQYVPDDAKSVDDLQEAAEKCEACHLHEQANHAVIGEGNTDADMLLVGEIPGDKEDKEGRPFVGPAGGKLDDALNATGLDRDDIFVTNAVKHFKFEEKGSRRIHQTPNVNEIEVCKPWLEAELRLVKPKIIVTLGTTAARSVLGRSVTISNSRGETHETVWGAECVVSYHPSAAIRHPYEEERERIFNDLIDDLAFAQRAISDVPPAPEQWRPRA